jgi:hypothetical protein
MRAVLHQDIVALAGSLVPVEPTQRHHLAELLIKLTDLADRHRIKCGYAHPLFGNGTLLSGCAQMSKPAERRLDDLDYADCMIKALEAVVAFRLQQR